ncbi:hypothetical protein [Ornithinibacillus contaminans]|uniref:hypothetical protein n=1 Tax=Ornithinibacillus contaminans TaxID=694055 RepID=UPI0012ECE608|nr:hypothetical protein [Ornithinibacillus contaminans]
MEKYIIQNTEKSFCPKCNKTVQIMFSEKPKSPAFYICFDCKFVGQIGVGEIRYTLEQY